MRNGAIDVLKFAFSWVIVIYHLYLDAPERRFPHGNIGVEFFVLVSGFYFFAAWEKAKQRRQGADLTFYPQEYIQKRFLRFFPYTTLVFAGAFVESIVHAAPDRSGDSVYRFINAKSAYLWELLLIGRNGIMDKGFLNGPVWTISAMLLAEFFVLSLLVRWEKDFYAFICPVALLVGYGYWRNAESAHYTEWIGFTTFGVLRVFLITCLACYCFQAVQRLKKVKFTRKGVFMLTFCEAVCYLMLLWIILNPESRYLRFAGTLLICIGCTITLSEQSLSVRLFRDSPRTRYLGELSFAIYLTHWTVRQWYAYVYGKEEIGAHLYSCVLIVLVVSVVFLVLVKRLIEVGRRFASGFMAEMIENEAIKPSQEARAGSSDARGRGIG